MNWFVSEPVFADGVLQASLPFLEVFCALVGAIALLVALIALLHTIFAVRSFESYQFGEAKQHVKRVGEALNLVRTPDERNRQPAVYIKVL